MTSIQRNSNRKGAALLTVLVAMMIITLLLFEFQFRAMVERRLAYNDLDQMRAYYLAKSGVNIGLLRLSLYGRAAASPAIRNFPKALNINTYLDMIWQMPLPPFPPQEASFDKLLKADKDAARELLKQTRVEDGEFSQVISSESSKINLNYLVVPEGIQDQDRPDFVSGEPKGLYQYVGQTLYNLINGFLKNSDDPYEEFGNLRPEEIVYDIMDWVSPGDERLLGGFKDAWYERQDPPYKAKKHRFYTIDELKLVKGMNDYLFRKLRPHITVFSYAGKININSARADIFKALYPDFTEEDINEILAKRAEINGWQNPGAFVTYISDELGRAGFKEVYDEPGEYPFGIGNRSFIVESLGVVRKSASEIQRSIKVAVAFVSESRGGQEVPGNLAQKDCKGNYFFDKRDSKCKYKPTTAQECGNIAGEWRKQGGAFCCNILKQEPICPASTGGGGTPTAKEEPANAMKILSWQET